VHYSQVHGQGAGMRKLLAMSAWNLSQAGGWMITNFNQQRYAKVRREMVADACFVLCADPTIAHRVGIK
jgi:hypothetical protein